MTSAFVKRFQGSLPFVLATASLAFAGTSQAIAQERVPIEAVRAINLARTHVVELNGGLNEYRPAQCMYATAAKSNPCLVRRDSRGFLFRFMGGVPTWEQNGAEPTIESEIVISADGTEVEELIYNGEPR